MSWASPINKSYFCLLRLNKNNDLDKLLLAILLLILSVISLFVGVKDVSFTDLTTLNDEAVMIMTISRIPRIIALLLAGIGLSVSGLIMQQIAQNKFVSPTTAGTLDAAKMGILMGVLYFSQIGLMGKMLLAFVFTFVANLFFLFMVKRVKVTNLVLIPILGIMFGNILNAISTFFAYKHNIVQNMQGWMMGDFSSVMQGRYEVIYLILPAVILTYVYANQFTVVGMGDSFSKNLGLNYATIVNIGLFCVSTTVSVVVITIGAIPFLGLVIPNVVSLIYGDNLRKTLPYTALYGAIFLVFCDILGRLIIFPFEIPIGMMIGVIGGIVFLGLLLKKNK